MGCSIGWFGLIELFLLKTPKRVQTACMALGVCKGFSLNRTAPHKVKQLKSTLRGAFFIAKIDARNETPTTDKKEKILLVSSSNRTVADNILQRNFQSIKYNQILNGCE